MELSHLMKKGTKFRESPNPNFKRMYSQIIEALDDYVDRWSRIERIDADSFFRWKRKVQQLIDEKLQRLKAKCRRYEQSGEILKKPEVQLALEELHKKFVICVVDKASNNFGLICKKFYFINQEKELGLDTRRYGNDIYLKIRDSEV